MDVGDGCGLEFVETEYPRREADDEEVGLSVECCADDFGVGFQLW